MNDALSRSLWLALFLAFWLLWILTLGWIRFHHADLDHGTILADSGVVIAGRYFDQHGILSNGALPVTQTYHEADAKPRLYFTYPPGRFWMHQLSKTLGLGGPSSIRVLPMIATSLAAILGVVVAFQLTQSAMIGALTGFFLTFNQAYGWYFDSLSESVRQATLLAALAAWLAFEQASSPARQRLWLGLTAAAVFLDAWFTLEHLILIPLFIVFRAVLRRDPRLRRGAGLILCVTALAISIRLAQVVAAVGLDTALAGFAGRARLRLGLEGQGSLLSTAQRLLPRLGLGGAHSLNNPARFPLFAPTVLAPAILLTLILVRYRNKAAFRSPRAAVLGGLTLLAAGSHWAVLMKEHAAVHPHTTLLLVPGAALILAGLTATGITPRTSSSTIGSAPRLLFLLLSLVLVLGFASEMRHSRTLNLVVPLDKKAVAHARYREAVANTTRLAAQQLRDAKRIVISPPSQPIYPALLGRPFQYEKEDSLASLKSGDYLWLHKDSTSKGPAALRLYGFPLRVGRPLDHIFVFDGSKRSGIPTRISLDRGVRILAVDISRTLEGRALTLQLLLSCDLSQGELNDLNATWEVVDSAGELHGVYRSLAAWTNEEALLSQVVQLKSLPADGAVSVRLAEKGESLKFDPGSSSTIEGMTLHIEAIKFSIASLLE